MDELDGPWTRISIKRPRVSLRNGTYNNIGSSDRLIYTNSNSDYLEVDSVRFELHNGGDAIELNGADFTMIDTDIVGHGPTAGLRAGSYFERESMTVAGNVFENVELRDYTDYDDLTLSDFEGDPRTNDGIIDDFEREELTEYSFDDEASLSDAAARNGMHGLDLDGNSNTSGAVRSDSGLGTYPGPDDIWEFWWNPQTTNQNFNVNFALQSGDLTEGFRVNVSLDDSNQLISFQERGSSGDTYLGQADLDIQTDTWYRTIVDGSRSDGWSVHVDTGEGSSVVGEFETDATQYTQYGTSGIAYWISGADRVYLDDIATRDTNPLNEEETPGTVVDDFEDGSLSEYTVSGADGTTASDTAAFRGSYGLELDGPSGGSGTIRSDSGLNAYPGQNDKWEFWWNPQTESEFFRVTFAIQSDDRSESLRLVTRLDSSTQYVQLQERGTNGDNYLGHADLDLAPGTWYRTVVDGTGADDWTISVDTGEGTATVGEFTSEPTQYTWYDRSGIAYWISGTDHVYLDDVTIRTEGEPSDDKPTLVVDDFEDGDLAEWTIPSQTGTVDTVTDSYDGSYALRCYDDGLTQAYANESNSPSVDYVPQPGDLWEFYVKLNTTSSNQTRFYFGRQGTGDDAGQYEIQLISDGTFRLVIDDGGSNGVVGTGTYDVNYDAGRWYRVRHWWQHPDKSADHVCELYDVAAGTEVATVSGDDGTWLDGDVGVWVTDSGDTSFDHVRILDRTG
ncbi:LamG domain-containing protein [Natrinema salaciae]|nr:hypothetical protein [Natrinema salaciae]